MDKKGFVYLETIIAIVILTSSLLLIYTTFNKLLQSEKTRVYYDEVSYVYRTENIKEAFNDINLKEVLSNLNSSPSPYTIVGIDSDVLFSGFEPSKTFVNNLLNDYEVSQILIVKENRLGKLKQCNACSTDETCSEYSMCNTYYGMISKNFANYIKGVYVDIQCNYVMLVEFNTCTSYCRNYYAWIGM